VALGLLDRLGIEDVVQLPRPRYDFALDPALRVLNPDGVVRFAHALGGAVAQANRDARLPIVVGGDCSILMGSLLGLRRRGRFGLAFIDGHRDYQTPDTSATGGLAGMDLAIATGRGPSELTSVAGEGPLVDPCDVVAVGFRDATVEDDHSSAIRESGIHLMDLDSVRAVGPGAVGNEVRARLEEGLEGLWVHLDVDVLSTTEMPAVDSPQPGGLTHRELELLLRSIVASCNVVGIQVTIYDPELDATGGYGRRLVETLAGALGERTR
jgi:arginase